MADRSYDLILAGGGLVAGLIAWRLSAVRPDLEVAVVERGPTLGGDHTWSYFDSDVSEGAQAWLRPLVAARWEGYDVRFPALRRTLAIAYNSIASTRFHAAIAPRLGERLRLGADIVEVRPDGVTLGDGARLSARGVIDCRGASPSQALELGWQKFTGLEVRLATPHGLSRPTVMDATVDQVDGYRFVYVLPFSQDRLLVEDTYYSDDADLDDAALRARIEAYARSRGWEIASIERSERGVLPIALDGDIEAFWRESRDDLPRAGMRAGLFHPTTGYSLLDAVATAELIAGAADLTSPALAPLLKQFSISRWRGRGFYRALNRMLFRACSPSQRWRVLERFYRLPEPLIRRFYAARMTLGDQARVLAGRPPVPVGAALRQLASRPTRRRGVRA